MFGPTEFAKRHIMKEKVRTALSLIIDHRIMERIKTCTERAHSNKNMLVGGRASRNRNFSVKISKIFNKTWFYPREEMLLISVSYLYQFTSDKS